MGLFDSILGIVADVFAPEVSIISDVIGGISGASDVASAVSDTSTVSLVGSILNIVNTLRDTLKPIVDTVAEAVGSIKSVVTSINDGIISPIITPILETQRTIASLVETLKRDWADGFAGILKIPQDIATAFGSLDGTMQRAVDMLNRGAAANLKEVFTLGLSTAGSATVDKLAQSFRVDLSKSGGAWKPNAAIHPRQSVDEGIIQSEIDALWSLVEELPSFVQGIGGAILHAIVLIPALLMTREPLEELWREHILKSFGVTKFETGTAVDLYARGLMTREDVTEELAGKGYSAERINMLLAATRRTPSDQQGLDWFYRGLIDQGGLRAILDNNNWTAPDQESVISASRRLPSSGDLLEAYRRAVIDEDGFKSLMQAQGWTEEWISVLQQIFLTPQTLDQTITKFQRAELTGLASMVGPDSWNASDELQDYGRRIGFSPTAVDAAWKDHFNVLSPALAVQAHFRGYITGTQLSDYLSFHAVPRGMHANYIDLQRPLIPYRTIAVLVAQGLVSESDGQHLLMARGFTLEDSNTLIQIEQRAKAPDTSQTVDTLHGLTQSTVIQLYDSGAATRDEAVGLLTALGMGADAVEALLLLQDVKLAATERQAGIDHVVAQAKAGLLAYEDVVSALATLGASNTETNKALAKIASGVKTAEKFPSESTILAMYKYGILPYDAVLDAMQVIGYSAAWAQLLIELGDKRGATTEQ